MVLSLTKTCLWNNESCSFKNCMVFFIIQAYCKVIYCDGDVFMLDFSSALEILFNPYRWKEKAFQMISSVSITLYGTTV